MVTRENLIDKYALISVFNKNKLNLLCSTLKNFKYKFIATESTCNRIKQLGFECFEVSEITEFNQILGGRVKTLNPKIFGSILYDRKSDIHTKEFKKLNIPRIDLVIINLYPFEKFSNKNDFDKTIEMIDIGGPSLIRASCKNYKYVTTICNIEQYLPLISNLNKNKGITDLKFRKRLAAEGFKKTSEYDRLIFDWLSIDKKNIINLRYGENPNQKAFIVNDNINNLINKYQLGGKEISFNNIIDVDNGINCLKEFLDPTCIILKHTNPCGVSSSSNIESAFLKALKSDQKSAFGGVVLFNRKIKENLAKNISKYFFEIIVASDFEDHAINILKRKKNLIILKVNNIKIIKKEEKLTNFGMIYQEKDIDKINKNFLKLVSKKKTIGKLFDDILFSLKVVKHLKSNAIVLASNKQTLGIGTGHTNRVDALKQALKNKNKNFRNRKFVCASDGFFPFIDSIKLLESNDCKVISQPSGSVNDEKIIEYAIKRKISLYHTKNRLFKH